MELVTGFQGKNHVTARQVSRLIAGLATDGETYVLKTLDQLPAELLNVNTVSIGTGDIIADGTYFTVEAPEEITIENGVTGLNRNDLIVARYLKAEPAVDEGGVPDYTIPRVESGELAVVKGAPSSGDPDDPAVVEASIYDDNTTLAEFPLYRIPIRGLSVGTPEPLFKILPPGAERWDSLSQACADIAALKGYETRTLLESSSGYVQYTHIGRVHTVHVYCYNVAKNIAAWNAWYTDLSLPKPAKNVAAPLLKESTWSDSMLELRTDGVLRFVTRSQQLGTNIALYGCLSWIA